MKARAIISVVDDDEGVRGSLASLLRSAGFDVRAFPGAQAFLSTGLRDGAACLLTDLNMPGMSGLELLAELRRRKAAIPVIMMTAFPTDQAKEQAMGNGAVAFLTKPLDPDLLLDRLKLLLAA